jgi:hypothetical protein
MLRIKGKPEKIAFKILGVPANLRNKKSERERQINRRLLFEETTRVR